MNSSQNNWNGAQVRRAKIVCTLGPASHSPKVIDHLLRAGMDVARLNFSHGTQEEHARTITLTYDVTDAVNGEAIGRASVPFVTR